MTWTRVAFNRFFTTIRFILIVIHHQYPGLRRNELLMILLTLSQPFLMLLLEVAQRGCIRNLLWQQQRKGRSFP